MKKVVFFITVVIFATMTKAQDSVLIKINENIQIGNEYYFNFDYITAGHHYIKAYSYSKELKKNSETQQEKVINIRLAYSTQLGAMNLYEKEENKEEIIDLQEWAVSFFLQTKGKKSFEYDVAIDLLNSFKSGNLNIKKSEKYREHLLRVYTKNLDDKNVRWEYLSSLYLLINYYGILKEYEKTIELYKKLADFCIEYINDFGFKQSYIYSLQQMSDFYHEVNNKEQALHYCLLLNDFIQKHHLEHDYEDDYLSNLEDLIFYYRYNEQLKNIPKAIGVYLDYKQYYETKNETKKLLDVNKTLAFLYSEIKDYANAEKIHFTCVELAHTLYGKNDYRYGNELYGLGKFYMDYKQNYNLAEQYFIEAKKLKDNYFFNNVIGDYSFILSVLGNIKLQQGKMDEAEVLYEEKAMCWYEDTYDWYFFMPTDDRKYLWNSSTGGSSEIVEYDYNFTYTYGGNLFSRLAYNNTLMAKGFLLRSANVIRDAVYSSGDKKLINQYEQVDDLRKKIGNLRQEDNSEERIELIRNSIDSLKAILRISVAYRDFKADMAMTWQEIQEQLKPDEAAIEFVSFRLYDKNWTDTIIYAALILRSGMEAPAWIPLCEQKELESILRTTINNTQLQTENLYVNKGKKLYQLVWQALEKELTGVKTIYYSPSGLLHKIAFNAIPVNSKDSLLCDRYNLNLVSSTRQIVALKHETQGYLKKDNVILYGGLYYSKDFQPSQDMEQQKTVTPNAAVTQENNQIQDQRYRGMELEAPSYDLRSANGIAEWKYLKGTKIEAEHIASELKAHNIPYNYFTELQGDEASFKALSGVNAGVIFIATHGFFLPDVVVEQNREIARVLGRGNRSQAVENPMLRSGLAMAGINRAWSSSEPVEDGEDNILTAAEIAGLNLTKTKLVILSACETGLGDVKNSEGVFGLQRAFKLAGVESLLMSLWKVPDEATMLLMTTFYNEWLDGKTKQQALKNAQKTVRKYKEKDYSLPFYWAAFVMMD